MRFDDGRSIYQQIVEYVQIQILRGVWGEEARLPAVRELAVELGVNPNTVQRSYSTLQDEELIYNQRGVGYFVAPGAQERSRRLRRVHLETEVLPEVFELMDDLPYTVEEFAQARRRWEDGKGGTE